MKRRRQTLGKKTYLVTLANDKGNGCVEVEAHTAAVAKQYAHRIYSREGWYVMSARVKGGQG